MVVRTLGTDVDDGVKVDVDVVNDVVRSVGVSVVNVTLYVGVVKDATE